MKYKAYISLPLILLIVTLSVVPFGCEETEKGTPPDLPPIESMVVDFSKFSNDSTKSAVVKTTNETALAYLYSGLTVLFWNGLITTTITVPVTSFRYAFTVKAEYIENNTWQWTKEYTIGNQNNIFNPYKDFKFEAKLTGKIETDSVEWKMYVSETGKGTYSDFLWFTGKSGLDGDGGSWLLYQSPDSTNELLTLKWHRVTDDDISVKYTYVKPEHSSLGSYLNYGLQPDSVYNVFYNVYAAKEKAYADIEWNTTTEEGHIKSEHYFSDTLWHCWDNAGKDIQCE